MPTRKASAGRRAETQRRVPASGTSHGWICGQTTRGPPAGLPQGNKVFPQDNFPELPGPPVQAPDPGALRAPLTGRLGPSAGHTLGRTRAQTEPECVGLEEAGRINGKPLRCPIAPALTKFLGVADTLLLRPLVVSYSVCGGSHCLISRPYLILLEQMTR